MTSVRVDCWEAHPFPRHWTRGSGDGVLVKLVGVKRSGAHLLHLRWARAPARASGDGLLRLLRTKEEAHEMGAEPAELALGTPCGPRSCPEARAAERAGERAGPTEKERGTNNSIHHLLTPWAGVGTPQGRRCQRRPLESIHTRHYSTVFNAVLLHRGTLLWPRQAHPLGQPGAHRVHRQPVPLCRQPGAPSGDGGQRKEARQGQEQCCNQQYNK